MKNAGPTGAQIKLAVDFALDQKRQGHAVYIHCAHGHGRSVAVLVACLIMTKRCGSMEEGEQMVKRVRPRARLNAPQRKAIMEWTELICFKDEQS